MFRMNFTFPEKVVLIILSISLLAGSVKLCRRRSRPFRKIVIVKGGIEQPLNLKDVEKHLAEKRRVNINTASKEELVAVPGLGEVLAEAIIESRARSGKFLSKTDLLDVHGIGEKKLERIKEYINIE